MDLSGKLEKAKGGIVWVSANMAVFRQLSHWYSDKVVHQFVPTSQFGFVVVTRDGDKGSGEIINAWAIFRPRAIELSWKDADVVKFSKMTLDYAVRWYNEKERTWEHITAVKR